MATANVSVTVSEVRKADNGLATGYEAYVTREGIADGLWIDEYWWTEDVMELVCEWHKAQRVPSKKRPAAQGAARIRKPTSNIAKEPATIAAGPQSGDRIEVCFPGPKRKWHMGSVTQAPHLAETGRVVYTVQYENGRIFTDHLSLPWRLYSRPEPREPSSGPQRHDRIEVAWPSEVDGRTRWITGKVLHVESVASDVGSFVRYTIYYAETDATFCDRLSLPWRPARTRTTRLVRPRTVEAGDAPPPQLTLREETAPATSTVLFDLNGSDSEADVE